MGQGLTLVGLGDSWAWGTELIDPTTINTPVWDFNLHHLPINQKYRIEHRYLNLFADKIGATSTVDLSWGGASNDTIIRNLIRWLTDNNYMSGRDTGNLFISIGWTSPERKDFYFNKNIDGHFDINGNPDRWLTIRPNSYHNHGYKELDQFFNLYVENFWNTQEYMHRWVNQIWQIETLLKSLNIKYVMHQAFYDHYLVPMANWDDETYIKNNHDTIHSADLKLWNIIDSVRFMNKDNPEIGTFYNYIVNSVGKSNIKQIFETQYSNHPNALGHKIWADYMYEYCLRNNLL